ncbi:hypothetical protein OF83DRAFT_1065651 [Amylostereum chailletii]|nr:hypothetical protein OF83DRAFT_1065651 [Amylostereum chailletii]
MLPRFLRPVPCVSARARAYSVFSSKSGGGRYFNSAKPPKVVPPVKANTSSRTDAPSSSVAASDAAPEDDALPGKETVPVSSASPAPHTSPFFAMPSYPPLSAQDLRLHQFFSLHRPLFLYQSPSTLFEPSLPFSLGPAHEAAAQEPRTIDNPPEASPEADTDTARQLARALAMNRVGATISWEDTLRHMGLDLNVERGQEQMDLAALQVRLDSTKRKKRKKMKKHK